MVLPAGDILVISGDLTNHGTPQELHTFNQWLGAKCAPKYQYRVVIAGNHETCLSEKEWVGEQGREKVLQQLLTHATHYLCDSAATIMGIRFYGTPWVANSKLRASAFVWCVPYFGSQTCCALLWCGV